MTPNDTEKFCRQVEYAQSRYAFLTECCSTYDEVDMDHPVKLLPAAAHVDFVVLCWEASDRVAFVKSRRMQVTWTLCGLDLHMAMFTRYSRVYIISDDLMKSELLIERCHFLWQHLPTDKCVQPSCETRKGQSGRGLAYIKFPELNSEINGVSGKPSEMRQEGATLLHVEEFQNWQWAEESWKAMLPTVQGGGKIVVVGSARAGSFFYKLVTDQISMLPSVTA